MATIIDSMTVKDTGWKHGRKIAQYNKFSKVNEKKCYALTSLNGIIDKREFSWATQSDGGVSSTILSPRIYTYDYGFNIPEFATILKVVVRVTASAKNRDVKDYLVTLKTGASLSDEGVGINQSEDMLWGRYIGSSREFGDDELCEEQWGISLTPSDVNNSNFGCVYQFCGIFEDKLSTGKLSDIAMKVYYTQLGTDATTVENTVANVIDMNNIDESITADAEPYYFPDGASEPTRLLPATKSVENLYDYMPFWLRFKLKVKRKNNVRYYKGAYYSKTVCISLNECLRFEDGSHYMEIPNFACWASTDEEDLKRGFKSYLVPIKVFADKVGTGSITVTGLKYYVDDDEEEVLTTRHFTIRVTDYYFEATTSMVYLTNCSFNGCDAVEGKCVYNTGRLNYENITIPDITSKGGKAWYDYDKYRDKEF